MRHEQRGHARAPQHRAQLVAHRLTQRGVEVGERLVEQQHARRDHERARQRDSLLFPAGKRLDRPLGLVVEADAGERLRAFASRSAFPTPRASSPNATFCSTVMCGKSA